MSFPVQGRPFRQASATGCKTSVSSSRSGVRAFRTHQAGSAKISITLSDAMARVRPEPEKGLRHTKRAKPQKRFESATLSKRRMGLMSEHAFFEYRAKPISTLHIEEQGEPIHYLIKMEIGAGHRRPRELLKQEARDLILFSVSPGPHRRISHSNICEVDEKRLHELDPATDFNRVGSVEIYFYSS